MLLMLFVSETFGVSRYVHFCGGEITSDSYIIEHKNCCCDDEQESAAMSDCCKDEVKIVQNTNDQVLPVQKGTDVPSVDFVTVFFSTNLTISIAPLVNPIFNKESQINQSFDTSPPIRALACCFVI